ncbi:MAG TPA: penicillin-binding protein 1B [Desulfobacterales bacterium]|nr:penicillin-binding protein 1B [Desulfobacterales bacterium]
MKKFILFFLLTLLLVGSYGAWKHLSKLNKTITTSFEGMRWELPARIYGRPLELYVGKNLQQEQLQQELNLLRYTKKETLEKPGEYQVKGTLLTIHSRETHFPDGKQEAVRIELKLINGQISSLSDQQSGQALPLFRLEPLHIASIYPGDNEDRLLVQIKDTPPLLIQALLLTEDKHFYKHIGIYPLAIVRALFANLKAGRTVQGGSTLTQQLVKNFFLTSEQSLRRKSNEALMALLLEFRYEKDDILESYLNEIYLGQDGKRAIHGFAMASKFYFQRNIDELSPDQMALLIGMAKGASYYNPRKHPERAKARRDLILKNMGQADLLSVESATEMQGRPLGVTERAPSGITPYPAFVQLVRQQLKRDYKDEDLQSEGLSVFTTFDPIIQQQAEESLQQVLTDIEKQQKLDKESLQGALVLCSVDQGEVLAVVGDRFPRQDGFNRALDMNRPVGSVIKPAVYLSALSQPDRFNLLSILNDEPLTIPLSGKNWEPQNYDKKYLGSVTLRHALIHSLNVPTVNLGLATGLNEIIQTIHTLGVSKEIPAFPSLLLGAVELPPITVLQMYQTIAAGGYKTPLRTILAVTDHQQKLLQSYPLTVEQAASPAAVFCLSTTMQEICKTGTGRRLRHLLPETLSVAGKTGTTDQLKDSWFAGFSGSHVAVAWVGHDDNSPTGLTGSTGAMRVWAEAMKRITTTPLSLSPPPNIDFYYSDIQSGQLFSDQCNRGELMPFIRDGLLPPVISCQARTPSRRINQDFQEIEKALHDGIQQIIRIFQ